MPPKRKTVLINKQTKLITSRLMQISLKVDDYVYNNVPISEKSALMFIEEVAGYEDKCYGDRPSLQVIEKLIRCMKGIIAEQQETKQGCNTNTDNVLVAEEPILAEEDPDLTQFTQNIGVYKNVTSPKNVIEVLGVSDDDEDVNKHLAEKEVAYLCNEENDTTNIKEKDFNCNETLQGAISKLRIEDEDSTSILNLGPDCSQSILDKLTCSSNIDDSKRSDANNIIFSQDLDVIIRPHTISREYHNSISAKNDTSITTVKTRAKSQHPNSNLIKSTECLKGAESMSQFAKQKNKTITKEKQRRQKKPNITKKCNKDSKENKKKTTAKRKKQNKIETIIDLTTGPKTNSILEIEDIAKEQNVPVEVTKSFNLYERTYCAQVQDYSRDTLESQISRAVYSKHVENGLSWIDNIRYVREVRQDENISTFLDESFWDDYTLPNDWNDDDFLTLSSYHVQ